MKNGEPMSLVNLVLEMQSGGAAWCFVERPLCLVKQHPMPGLELEPVFSNTDPLAVAWDEMETRGWRWLFNRFTLLDKSIGCAFLFCGDKLCEDVRLLLSQAGMPDMPPGATRFVGEGRKIS